MIQIQNYINGELISPKGNGYLNNIDPSRGKVYSQIPDSKAEDIAVATEAAKKAFHTPGMLMT